MKKILIVDDEKHIGELYSEELEDEGYNVTVKNSPEGLCDVIKKEGIDLLISDLKISPWNMLEELQKVKNHYDIPIIINTAYDSYKEDLLSLVADDYQIKDIGNFRRLKKSVERHLDLYRKI